VSMDREQVLSEFIDAWNAGERPDVDDYIARVPAEKQVELAEELIAFLTLAPTPEYSDEALAAIRAEPVVAQAAAAGASRGGLLPDAGPPPPRTGEPVLEPLDAQVASELVV
jgi:hypothetical protein